MKKKNIAAVIISMVLAVLSVWGGIVAFRGDADSVFYEGSNPELPTLDIYTSGGATTPQLALFAAIREGDLKTLFNFRIHLWKNPDDLLSNVMAGKGDLWIGHTEGFAIARMKGAPVQMLVFTSFHKFYILSSINVSGWRDLTSSKVAYAPPGSPAFALMQRVMEKTSVELILEPYQGRELELLIASGKVKTAILPEPLVTLMLTKNSKLKVVANVEELFCSVTDTSDSLPIAGIAVNESTARKFPEKIAQLQKIILKRTGLLKLEGKKAARYFPEYFQKYIPPAIVEQSLERDTISAEKGSDMKTELGNYLNAVYPEIFKNTNMADWCGTFLWQ